MATLFQQSLELLLVLSSGLLPLFSCSDSDGFKAPGKVPLRSALPTHVFPVKTSSAFE